MKVTNTVKLTKEQLQALIIKVLALPDNTTAEAILDTHYSNYGDSSYKVFSGLELTYETELLL